jgi:formate/nitrite transporter
MPEVFGFDCYSPREIAERVENVGVTKARLPLISMVALGILAGGFIGLGAMFFTLVQSDAGLSFAVARVLGGVVFSLGLVLVVIAGAELFTGNNLLVMAWVSGRISLARLLLNLSVVFTANLMGAAGLALLVAISGHASMNHGAVGETAVALAAAKCSLPFGEAFFKAVLGNILVCLAVWLAMAGRTVTDKMLAIIFPVSAFVACGFEHCIANMYLIPLGIFLQDGLPPPAVTRLTSPDWSGFIRNLIPVTLGNLTGGAGMVGLIYGIIYRRTQPATGDRQDA